MTTAYHTKPFYNTLFLLQFFFNNGSFPLYAKALSLFDHRENIVRKYHNTAGAESSRRDAIMVFEL